MSEHPTQAELMDRPAKHKPHLTVFMDCQIKIKKTRPDTPDPARQYDNDVGIDLTVMAADKVRECVYLLDMGIAAEAPAGHYLELHARSSIYKTDFMMANKIGIIDPSYRGTIYMPVRYLGSGDADASVRELVGVRFGQLILRELKSHAVEIVSDLSPAVRGEKGLGSTGS